jgi:hypothetical protein
MSEKEFLLTAGKSIIAFDGLPPLFTYQLTIFMFTNINMHQNGIFLLTAGLENCPELHAGYVPLLIKIVHRSALGNKNLFQH